MPKKSTTKDVLVSKGFPEKFLLEMAEAMDAAIKNKDVDKLGPLIEKFESSGMHRFPAMTKLLDEYVGQLTGVDVAAMREAVQKQ